MLSSIIEILTADEIRQEKITFMERMLETYSMVHNGKYWSEISDLIKENASGTCLEIGCGPGLLLKDLSTKFNSSKLIGMDLSDVMLDKAKEILSDEVGKDKVELILQHMQENQKLPSNVDIVFASRVLRSFDDQIGILESIKNSLNKGGQLVILDWDKKNISDYQAYFENNERFGDLELSDLVRYHRNFSRYSIQDWIFILTGVGFKIDLSFQLDPVHIVVVAKKS